MKDKNNLGETAQPGFRILFHHVPHDLVPGNGFELFLKCLFGDWKKKQFRNLMNKILRVYSVPLNHQTIWLISWKDYLTPPTFSRTLRWKSRDWRIWKNLCFDLRACLLLLFFCTLWWIFFKLLSFRSESCRVENNFFTTFNINKQWLDISLTRMI